MPLPPNLTETGRMNTIAALVGAKSSRYEDILYSIRAMTYNAKQLKLILSDVLRHLNGIEGNVSKAKQIVTERIDFIELEMDK